jgi:hypothetical protein
VKLPRTAGVLLKTSAGAVEEAIENAGVPGTDCGVASTCVTTESPLTWMRNSARIPWRADMKYLKPGAEHACRRRTVGRKMDTHPVLLGQRAAVENTN